MSRFVLAIIVAASGTLLVPCPAVAQPAGHAPSSAPPGHHNHDPGTAPTARAATHRPSDPFPLTTCPVSGEELGGAMGEPVVKDYDGREVRFCCGACVADFEAAPAGFWEKIDEQIVEQQIPFYPLTTCLVTGDPLADDGEDVVNFVYQNRLVRFCCSDCIAEYQKDPETMLERLDGAVVQQQRDNYPLATCLVSGDEIGAMGEAVEVVIGNRLVRLCCAECEADLRAQPAKYLTTLDEAWAEHGMPEPTDTAPDPDHAPHEAPGHHGG